jgi:acyl dehydratase
VPLSTGLVGAALGHATQDVDPARAMAYAAALGASEQYLAWPDDGVPPVHPAFLVCLEWVAVTSSAGRFGLEEPEQHQALHLAHASTWFRPIRACTRLTTTATVEEVQQRSAGAVLVLRLDTVDERGDLVAMTRQTMLYRGVAVSGEGAPAPARPDADPAFLPHKETIDVAAGLPYVYTECSAISFPIHTDPRVARAAGLPGVILHGTATMALALSRILDRHAGGDPARLRSMSLGFGATVPVPTTLTLRHGEPADGSIPFEVLLPDGRPAIRDGLVTLQVP